MSSISVQRASMPDWTWRHTLAPFLRSAWFTCISISGSPFRICSVCPNWLHCFWFEIIMSHSAPAANVNNPLASRLGRGISRCAAAGIADQIESMKSRLPQLGEPLQAVNDGGYSRTGISGTLTRYLSAVWPLSARLASRELLFAGAEHDCQFRLAEKMQSLIENIQSQLLVVGFFVFIIIPMLTIYWILDFWSRSRNAGNSENCWTLCWWQCFG